MTIASVGTLGTVNDTSAGTTVVLTTSAAAEAGHLVVIVVAKDNLGTTKGQTSEITGITDSAGGNTWTLAGEYCNSPTGAANDGVTCSVWFSVLTNQINSGGTITATMSSSTTNSGITAWEYTIGAGNTVMRAGTIVTDGRENNATLAALTCAPGLSAEYLYVRGIGIEGTVSFTVASGFTQFTDSNGAITALGEFVIETSSSRACAASSISNLRDHANVFFALKEVSATGVFYLDQGSVGVGSSNASTSTVVTTTTAPVAAGQLVVAVVAKDNVQTTDGQTSEVTSITDSAGNIWTLAGEFCNGQGGANLGAVVSVWTTTAVSMPVGTTITANMSSSITSKAMTVEQFAFKSGSTLSAALSLQTLADDGGDAGSMAISGLTSALYLYIRGTGGERTMTLTATSGYAAMADSANAGSGTAAISANGEFTYATGTGSTSDPTMNQSTDLASVFFAIKQTAAVVANGNSLFFGAGL